MKEIRLYNTETRNIDNFVPIKPGEVGIYSCGPTVYHYAHIGNLRSYIFADILRRTFVYNGLQVKHIINITDVGHNTNDDDNGMDKMEKGSLREGKSAFEIAEYYTQAFMDDLFLLNIPQEKYIFPRATDNIQEQINIVKTLEEKGFTYTISDGVYFDTSKFANYGKMAKLDIEGLKSGARVEENKEKKNITDFALWKLSKENEKRQMEWDSPWGIGFPGWHIECSAMSEKYLGKHFDIHTGGIDHIPVHHTNEIAQSEAVNNEKFVNYWIHVNFLNDKSGKMSKSNEDFLRLKTLTSLNYLPLSFKYLMLTTHYRKETMFSYESLDGAQVAYKKLYNFCAENFGVNGKINEEYKNKFEEFLFNDISTPECIALIWEMLKDETLENNSKYATILLFDEVLGLNLKEAKKEEVIIPDNVKGLLEARASARLTGNYQESDRLRDEILSLGYIVKDGKDGQSVDLLNS